MSVELRQGVPDYEPGVFRVQAMQILFRAFAEVAASSSRGNCARDPGPVQESGK
nr:hypothetical protein [Cryptosporangium phraense]